MSSGFRYLPYNIEILLEFEFIFFFVDIMPPRKGRGKPHNIPMDEEVASATHAPFP